MTAQIVAIKKHMLQAWTKSGERIPVTVVQADSCFVIGQGTQKGRVLVGTAKKKLKNVAKPQRALLEKQGFSFGFRKLREVRLSGEQIPEFGTQIKPEDVVSIGDMIKVTGTSKGTGFTGVVKRHGFAGGPRTHGQHDRERAPGSIGAGTTPGRVYKNKRMAGRSGNAQVTVEGLTVVALNVAAGEIWIKGPIPGSYNGIVTITKLSSGKFDGLLEKAGAVVAEPVPVDETISESSTENVSQEPVLVEENKEVIQPETQAAKEESSTEEVKA